MHMLEAVSQEMKLSIRGPLGGASKVLLQNSLALLRCRRGNIAILTAVLLPLVGLMVFGVIDISRGMTARQRLQDALDAAALFAARSSAVTDAELQEEGASALAANLINLDGDLVASSFTAGDEGRSVLAAAQIDVVPFVLGIVGMERLRVSANTEIMRSNKNVEVSLVLDTTGSMAGSRISDLKVAAADLVDIVVRDQQTPFYTKVALAPYSMGVNVGSYATQLRGSYNSGTCNSPGCKKYRFENPYGDKRTFSISTCVTERTGAYAYTDAAPSSAPLGWNYPSPNNPCLKNEIMPLSSDKGSLKGAIGTLSAGGSTGGHIGVAWGWYLVSPKFGYLWPNESRPSAYGRDDTVKAVVIMTDGEYNSVYCNGVISEDSTSGSGSNSDHIGCGAPNGNAYDQAIKLCTNMKAAGVIVYTVGFDVVNTQKAKDLVARCATDASHVYMPKSGGELKEAFRAIGHDISALRIAR